MATTLVESVEARRIGSVVYVSPNEVKIRLDFDSPESVALNTGTPVLFPKVNSYLLIPSDCSQLVCQVTWAELSDQGHYGPKGDKTFVALPFASRLLSLSPLGMLSKTDEGQYKFSRGADSLPAIGEQVLLPTVDQVKAIVTSGDNLRVKIGTSPLAENADVKVDPDRLFGRHLAILGNTGSGKSCSVAGIVRWVLEAAASEKDKTPNARIVILDPNGEYKHVFKDLRAKVFQVDATEDTHTLQVPLWLLNTEEWTAVLQASGKTQRPTLITALRNVRTSVEVTSVGSPVDKMRHFLTVVYHALKVEIEQGVPFAPFPRPKNFGEKLQKWVDYDFEPSSEFTDEQKVALEQVRTLITEQLPPPAEKYKNYTFARRELEKLLASISDAHKVFGGTPNDVELLDADSPCPFSADGFLKIMEASAEMLNTAEYVETMIMRLKTVLGDVRLKNVFASGEKMKLGDWLKDYIGGSESTEITVLDLSLLPSEIIYIVTSVVARITFEAVQRYRKLSKNAEPLPTVLVMEEAHTFLKRYIEDDGTQSASIVCCKVFERIAREGRKFGLGLVLSSQRPSELSPTVLSQCNTFLLHRISNDKDQELVKRLLPDNLHGLMRDLPVLPSRQAILLGWAAELPVLVQMRELPKEQRPQSSDPDFWDVWTRQKARDVDWKQIADDWQGVSRVSAVGGNAEGGEEMVR